MRALVVGGLIAIAACGGGDDDDDDDDDVVDASVVIDGREGGDGPAVEDLDMRAEDFGCILDGTKVRAFYVSNPLGHLDEALEVAGSAEGGTYPVGTIIQLVPQEAMVKRREGWNPVTKDWEFFALSVSGDTTEISARGVEDVENAFGGNCFDCHALAQPQWDLICEDTHGCDPLPISDEVIENLQNGDSRCD